MLSFDSPRLRIGLARANRSAFLPPSLAVLAVLFVAVGLLSVWPEPWDEQVVTTSAPESAPPARVFSAQLHGVAAMQQPVTMTPLFEGGVPRGLALGSVFEGSLFAHMGLQEGDVLLSFHDLGAKDAPLLVAHIERGGRPMRVEYSVSAHATSAPPVSSPLSLRAAAVR